MDAPERLLARLDRALAEGVAVRLVVGRADGSRGSWRPLGDGAEWLATERSAAGATRTAKVARDTLGAAAARELAGAWKHATLTVGDRDWMLQRRPDGSTFLGSGPAAAPAAEQPRTHDRERAHLLRPEDCPWLEPLGLAGKDGRLRATAAAKWRQVARWVELLHHHAGDLPDPVAGAPAPVWADAGCGKGYLTFALAQYWRQVRSRPVRVVGLERRVELADQGNRLAATLGWAPMSPDGPGLVFVAGEIDAAPLPAAVEGFVALHACDTATDDALARALGLGASAILAAPCCHRQLRPLLRTGSDAAAAALVRHGLGRERFAELLTDTLRALALERAGHAVKLVEWVAGEDTPRNTLLVARRGPGRAPALVEAEIAALRALLDDRFATTRLGGLLAARP